MWQKTIDYAKNCSWRAGPFLAKQMESNEFSDWERVFIAIENRKIAGYCTFAKKDCIPNVDYTPYIGFIFVGERYRGNRISEKMIYTVIEYAKQINFDKIGTRKYLAQKREYLFWCFKAKCLPGTFVE